MTDSNLLELAKLGDPQAIAALMNQSLQSRGMNAIVERQGDCLEVTLEAERIPNRQALTAFVQQGINNLGIRSITSIRIVGQQVGASYPAWMQEVQLGAQGNPLSNPLGGLDDLNNLAATTPLNIQPETETEITAIPLADLSEQNGVARGAESVDLNAADLSFLPDAEPEVATDELPDAELSSSDEISDEMLAALTEPAVSSSEAESLALELDAEPETDIAPDFLQELLLDADESDRSLFAESPDGTLDTLEGSPDENTDAELDLFFDEFEQSDATQPETSGELDADLLDFLNQPDADLANSDIQSDIQPDFTLDALLDPSAELTDADLADLTSTNLTATPETAASEQPALFDDAEINEFAAVAPSEATPTDSLLSSQIEELFDSELDQPDSGYIEEILPERPTDTAEDLRQALVEAPFAEPTPETQDPWTVSVLPELSEARTVLDLDDDPEGGLPAFMVEPRPNSPDAAIEPGSLDQLLADAGSSSEATDTDAPDDLDSLFADSQFTDAEFADGEEPPISTLQNDPIFYGSISDEEIAEEDLVEELPPDFLQDFAEFPDGFPNEFSEAAPPVGEPSEPPQTDLFLGDEDSAALPASNDLAAELAALDLTADLTTDTPAEPTAVEPATAESSPDFELTTFDQPGLPDRFDESSAQSPADFTATDPTFAPAPDLTTNLETDLQNTEDADLADLLSETPQGTVVSTSPAETSPSPQAEDFFSEPIAPVEATLETEPEADPVSLSPSERPPQPEVSQDVLEAGLGDFREGLVEPLPEEFFVDDPHPAETDWQSDLRDPLDLSDDSEANYVIEDSTPAVVYTPPPLPESDKTQTSDRSSSSWLFPLVLLFVVAWVAGLLGFTLFRSRFEPLPSPPPAGESPDAPSPVSPAPAAPASPTSQQPTPPAVANLSQGTSLETAIEQASDAVALTQAAQSADDWGLVASKWQQAVNLLKTIPNTSPDYAAAQQKLTEYAANVTTARQKANLPIVAAAPLSAANVAEANSPSPTASPSASPNASPTASPSAAAVVCNSVPSTPNSQPVELSRVQFDPTVDQAQASPLVGCITNHTEQPIAAVNVAYKNSNAAEATTGNLNFGQLDPKQTVPFKSGFTITPQVENLTIASISWTAAGTSDAKEFPATISVTRVNEDG